MPLTVPKYWPEKSYTVSVYTGHRPRHGDFETHGATNSLLVTTLLRSELYYTCVIYMLKYTVWYLSHLDSYTEDKQAFMTPDGTYCSLRSFSSTLRNIWLFPHGDGPYLANNSIFLLVFFCFVCIIECANLTMWLRGGPRNKAYRYCTSKYCTSQ